MASPGLQIYIPGASSMRPYLNEIILIAKTLNGSNYDCWRITIIIALDAKNKFAFIDGSLVGPSESHPNLRI